KRTYGTSIVNGTSQTNTEHDTYYVYDDYGNLTYVLPPKMDASDTDLSTITGQLDDLGYQYKYDNKNRLVEKKIPGKDPEYIVYNTLDQPILTQDAIQKTNGEWLFTKYDVFGRVAYTGKSTSATTTTREAIQTEVNALSGNLWITQSTSSTNYGGLNNVFYNNGAYPNNSGTLVTLSEILTINYYDTYVDRPTSAPSSVVLMESSPSETNATNVKSLATVSKVKVLDVTGTDVWINTLSYYDSKSRPIYVYNENTYLGTVDIIETKLDFVGKPLKSKTTHTRNGITIATIDNFTYDHTGRLLTQTQCIGDQTMGYTCPGSSATVVDLPLTGNITSDQVASRSITLTNGTIFPDNRLWISPEIQEVIVDNIYDELGQLENKGVGGNILNTDRLQTVDYIYNIRGWLKQINDPTTMVNDLFSFKLGYNEGANALYNGNISTTQWKTANTDDSSLKTYNYQYDALNRITSGIDDTGHYNLNAVVYDKNGNITTLNRQGHIVSDPTLSNSTHFGVMDNLTYSYDTGNKLMKVSDAGNNTFGFKDDYTGSGVDPSNDYTYDLNGNMLRDSNKGINSDIQYNHLNLPTQVTLDSGTISYIYDATGVKLQKKVIETGKPDAYTYYAGNYIYQDSALKFFNHPEGYLEPKNESDLSQGFNYVYQYKDHLGNVRLSYMDSDGDGSITASTEILEENNYYPFGLKHKGYNNAPVTNHKYELYNGVEFEESLGLNLYEMDLRQYDPAIARWISVDPVTHYSASTYNAFDNNPVFFADPSGADSIYNFDTKQYVIDGTVVTQDEAIAYAQNGGNADGSNNNTADASESSEDCCGEYVGSYKHKMGPKERNYYRNNKDKKEVVSKAAYKAGILASRFGTLGGDNLGYSGAIRHSYWMYLVAVELGPELAEKLGMLHEDYTVTIGEHKGRNNLTSRDSRMDVVNNSWGINLARENPNLDYLGFEDLFFNDATSKNNTTIRILDTKTIPKESLRTIRNKRKGSGDRARKKK
ncbi:MAG: RHS repeat-associated core domain-containing protein, partial [Algibacter sp.]